MDLLLGSGDPSTRTTRNTAKSLARSLLASLELLRVSFFMMAVVWLVKVGLLDCSVGLWLHPCGFLYQSTQSLVMVRMLPPVLTPQTVAARPSL
uniref:Uncharacterized protein n=1 Tax=Aegilops tauschii subsp. strangulata TaxID=200361 RepID=A0A453N6U0_AEGTS